MWIIGGLSSRTIVIVAAITSQKINSLSGSVYYKFLLPVNGINFKLSYTLYIDF